MRDVKNASMDRRKFLVAAAASGLAAPALAQSDDTVEIEAEISQTIRRNISSFRTLEWEPYFSNLRHGAILVDVTSRALHYWSEDLSIYKLYPTSVPLSEDLTRLGRTKIIRKVVGPSWSPTPAMIKSNPDWPASLTGYAPVGSPTAGLLGAITSKVPKQRVTLKIRPEGNSHQHKQVVIERVLANGWVQTEGDVEARWQLREERKRSPLR